MKRVLGLMLVLALLFTVAFAESEEFTPLRNGSRGEEVVKAQEQLKILGFLWGKADGFFGSYTENAVKAFQAKNGLEETGVLDQSDLAKLYSSNAKAESDEYEYRNLLYYTADPVYAGAGNPSNYAEGIWREASGCTGTREVVDVASPILGITKGFHITGTVDSHNSTDVAVDHCPLVFGESYTLSCFAKGSGQVHLQNGKTSWLGRFFTVSEDWKQYSYTFTVGNSDGATAEDSLSSIYFGAAAGVDSDITICGMKLEKVRATEWSANPADSIRTRTLPSNEEPKDDAKGDAVAEDILAE